VHEDAERLEHFISERFEDRVVAIPGDPEITPHGHVIPQKYAAGVYREEMPLAQWRLQKPAAISSVSDRSPRGSTWVGATRFEARDRADHRAKELGIIAIG